MENTDRFHTDIEGAQEVEQTERTWRRNVGSRTVERNRIWTRFLLRLTWVPIGIRADEPKFLSCIRFFVRCEISTPRRVFQQDRSASSNAGHHSAVGTFMSSWKPRLFAVLRWTVRNDWPSLFCIPPLPFWRASMLC